MGAEERRARRRAITVRAVDATGVRAQRIITATLPNITVTTTIRTETFPATPDQVARVRQVVKETIADHPAFDTTVLLASELAANAVRYSSSEFFGLVIAGTGDAGLRVAVFDEGHSGFPCLQEETLEDESGRGLRLLDTMALRWGITRQRGTGIAIWFDTT
jgi:anti-sigma regulatory factor (Ser/Thr protein kinase)